MRKAKTARVRIYNHSVPLIMSSLPLPLLLIALCLEVPLITDALVSLDMCEPGPCKAGQYHLVATNSCLPCEADTFMGQSDHQCDNCKACSQANIYNDQVVIANCTPTTDTVLGCTVGFFAYIQDDWEDLECLPCRQCEQDELVKKNCMSNSDTVCVNDDRNSSGLLLADKESQPEDTTQMATKWNKHSAAIPVSVLSIITIVTPITAILLLMVASFYLIKRCKKRLNHFNNKEFENSMMCLTTNEQMNMNPLDIGNTKIVMDSAGDSDVEQRKTSSL